MKPQVLLFFMCIFMGCALQAQPITLSTPAQSFLVFQTPDGRFYSAKAQAHTQKEGVLTAFFKSKDDKWECDSLFQDDEIQKISAFAYGIADTVPVLFAAANDGDIKLYDYYGGDWRFADRFQAHEGPVTALAAFDYNNNIFVVSAGTDSTVALFKQTVTDRYFITRLTISADKAPVSSLIILTNTVVITHEDGNITLWDISNLIE